MSCLGFEQRREARWPAVVCTLHFITLGQPGQHDRDVQQKLPPPTNPGLVACLGVVIAHPRQPPRSPTDRAMPLPARRPGPRPTTLFAKHSACCARHPASVNLSLERGDASVSHATPCRSDADGLAWHAWVASGRRPTSFFRASADNRFCILSWGRRPPLPTHAYIRTSNMPCPKMPMKPASAAATKRHANCQASDQPEALSLPSK